jgi:hypothetical protein
MKRALIAFCALAITSSVMAQVKPAAQTTAVQTKKADEQVKFTEVSHDFGKIKQGVPVTYDFAFQNNSNQPAVIESATASCGCTTPTWPKTPVAKNKSEKISAGFNAASAGTFTKTITVKVAGYDQPLVLTITGEVLSPEEYAKFEGVKGKKNS